MILNDVLYYGNEGPEPRPHSAVTIFYDFESADHWYIDFLHGHHLLQARENIPPDILDQIRARKVTLTLNNSHEAFHDPVESIYQYFVLDLNIPPTQITLLSESASIGKEIYAVAEKYNTAPISAVWIRMFEYNISYQTEQNKILRRTFAPEKEKTYIKKFLCLNRRWRMHRPILVGLLKSRSLLDKGLVSLVKNVDGSSWDKVWSYLEQPHLMNTEMYHLLKTNQDLIEQIPDLYLDTKDMQTNQASSVQGNINIFYENTFFSVVNETNYFKEQGEGIFFSEKVFKPVFQSHPFILVSRPHSFEKFRDIGYKSFHPFINESYDSEEDDVKRLLMIVDEIERLSNMSDVETSEFILGLREIITHNYKTLLKKQNKIKCSFTTKLIYNGNRFF